jgi:hypothetical protein
MKRKFYEINIKTLPLLFNDYDGKCPSWVARGMLKHAVRIILDKHPKFSWNHRLTELNMALAKNECMDPKDIVLYAYIPEEIADNINNRMFMSFEGSYSGNMYEHNNLTQAYYSADAAKLVWFMTVKRRDPEEVFSYEK